MFHLIKRLLKKTLLSFNQLLKLIKEEGFLITSKKVSQKIYRILFYNDKNLYKKWQNKIESQYLNDSYYQAILSSLENNPMFSIIFPVYNKEIDIVKVALESILNQKYTNYEICISDGSTKEVKVTRDFLEEFAGNHKDKVKLSFIDTEGINIIENTNNALSIATGEYVVFMDCDDELSANCLLELAKVINNSPSVKFIYSDFDHIDREGKRFSPSFWPDWSPHLLLSQMYTTHVTCYKRDLLEKVGKFREGTAGAQDWDLVFRVSEALKREEIVHIPKILYHWRAYEDSTAMAGNKTKGWAYQAQIKSITDHIRRRGYDSLIKDGPHPGIFQTDILVKGEPSISILIAFKDKVEYLKKCIKSIREHSQYNNYQIVIIDNNSVEEDTLIYVNKIKGDKDIKVLNYNEPFHFGKMYNWACEEVNSDYLLILNNDIEVITNGWIQKMLGYAQLNDVGYVGAKLLYPDMRVQHAGVLVGHRGTAGHLQVLSRDKDYGYLSSLVVTRNYLALTGACLMIQKKKFFEVGGFEESLDPAYQDVDMGIKLYEKGYYNVYLSHVKLIHYESVSRLDDKLGKDLVSDEINAKKLRARWPKYIFDEKGYDPFYNQNLDYSESDCRMVEDNRDVG